MESVPHEFTYSIFVKSIYICTIMKQSVNCERTPNHSGVKQRCEAVIISKRDEKKIKDKWVGLLNEKEGEDEKEGGGSLQT